jgi:histone H3/H4
VVSHDPRNCLDLVSESIEPEPKQLTRSRQQVGGISVPVIGAVWLALLACGPFGKLEHRVLSRRILSARSGTGEANPSADRRDSEDDTASGSADDDGSRRISDAGSAHKATDEIVQADSGEPALHPQVAFQLAVGHLPMDLDAVGDDIARRGRKRHSFDATGHDCIGFGKVAFNKLLGAIKNSNEDIDIRCSSHAKQLLKEAAETHLRRLLRDASTTARAIRGKSRMLPKDVANARSRGVPQDLGEFLERCELEATEPMPKEFEGIKDHVLRSFASQEEVSCLRGEVVLALRMALFKFLGTICTSAYESALAAKRSRISVSDVTISLRSNGRTVM